ncbi:MAG: zinc-binding dehydrogenase [Clostridia bacterium]|nr:zinc-binding dehydrogenase [Clostridia bacterium]MBQ4543890.1 zinc-binding dehydrogenase [Clostridia bacterium]MBQ7075187.1 zinc-binding dehydrogenase [Clostridia bacterium]MBQ9997411.1 zinc-binding dehydrogenase [Clostridia bacterium]
MRTKAARLYGANDARLEEFELRPITSGELLIKIISDSVCMSTHKTILQGEKHLRVPEGIAENPIILGHEFCAEVVEVGDKWKHKFKVGDKVVMPPVLAYLGGAETVGYTFEHIGGVSTYSIVYEHILDNDFLIKLNSDSYFNGSLIEPASCVIRGYKASFHLDENYNHVMGIKKGGKVAILAGCGPMGLVAIDIALHGPVKPSMVVVTDLDKARLDRAASIFSKEKAKEDGIELVFAQTSDKDQLMEISGGTGFDDVFVYAPVPAVVELGDAILGFDGCLNFFAGPLDKKFSANFNFYNVHYAQHHVTGTSGSTPEDMRDIVDLIGENRLDPSVMITHIGGIDVAIDTTIDLPNIPGGKKLIYTHINLPLTALTDFEKLGETDERFKVLDTLVKENNGLWNTKAEKYLLENF